MAMSAETEAIIARLKAEGDLIRNTGTNSLKTVRTEFAKFDGVFNSINQNIAEQTSLMKAQLGIAEEAAERAKTQEQLGELGEREKQKQDNKSDDAGSGADKTNEKIDAIAAKISEGFSFKNILMGAAGAFAGYNLLKGFIDEKTGGGFTEFESNMGNMVKGLANTDFNALGETITGMGDTLTNMQTTMNSLADSVASLNEAIEQITSIDWLTIAQTVLTSIGALTAYNLTMRAALRLMGNGPGGGGGAGGRRGLFRRLLAGGMTVATLGGIFGREAQADIDSAKADVDDEASRTAKRNATDQIRAADRQAAEAAAAAAAKTAATSASPSPSVMSNAPTMEAPNINIETSGNTTRYRDAATGRYVAASTAVPQLNAAGLNAQGLPNIDTTPAVRPVTGSGRGNGQLEVDQRRAAAELGKVAAEEKRGLIKRLARSKIGKVVAMSVPVVGLFAGLGFAGWNIIQGDFTSAALQLGSIPLPSISGAALDISSIVTEIFFAVSGETYNPANPAHNSLMEEIGKEVHAAYEEFMSEQEGLVKNAEGRRELYDNQEANELAAAERAQMGGAQAFADSGYNPGIGNQSLGSNYYTGENVTLGSSSSFRGNYFVDKNGIVMFQDAQGNVMRASERPDFNQQLNSASGGAGANGVTIIDGTTNVSAPVTVSDAGSAAQITNIFGEQGRGGGYSVYGLPGAIG
jgi:hypothetical protein